jgi:hypothetical protein
LAREDGAEGRVNARLDRGACSDTCLHYVLELQGE